MMTLAQETEQLLSKRLVWSVNRTIRIDVPMDQARNFSVFEMIHGDGMSSSAQCPWAVGYAFNIFVCFPVH
jgi:hypothetical protein